MSGGLTISSLSNLHNLQSTLIISFDSQIIHPKRQICAGHIALLYREKFDREFNNMDIKRRSILLLIKEQKYKNTNVQVKMTF